MSPPSTKTALSLLLLLMATLVTIGTTLDCSSLYFKETEGILNYLGNLTFTVPYSTENGWNVYFLFHRNFTGIGVFQGHIIQNDADAGSAVMTNSSTSGNLTSGQDYNFRFRINWWEASTPAKDPPVLISFKFGDVELCQTVPFTA